VKNNHVLIDYENVQPEVAAALAQPMFKVWVFVGAQQAKVKFDLVDLVQQKGQDAKVVKMGASGRNALDFHMTYYLGQLSTQEPDAYFHLIGKDAGMDALIEHLRQGGLNVFRWTDVLDIPVTKAPASESQDDKLSRILEYLVRRGRQRPATMATLIGSISVLFHPKLEVAEATTLVEHLRDSGVYQLVGTKLRYGLPEGD